MGLRLIEDQYNHSQDYYQRQYADQYVDQYNHSQDYYQHQYADQYADQYEQQDRNQTAYNRTEDDEARREARAADDEARSEARAADDEARREARAADEESRGEDREQAEEGSNSTAQVWENSTAYVHELMGLLLLSSPHDAGSSLSSIVFGACACAVAMLSLFSVRMCKHEVSDDDSYSALQAEDSLYHV